MFATLFESRPIRQRRTVSSVTSVAIHGFIITLGALATGPKSITALAPEPRPRPIPFVRPVEPRPVTTRPVTTRSIARDVGSVSILAALPRLPIPDIRSVGIPRIVESGIETTPVTFGTGPVGRTDFLCARDCASGTATDSAGRSLWSASEIAMRLVETPPPPRFPEVMRRAGIEGEVVVKFLVDTLGRVDTTSIEVIRSTHQAFTAAVIEMLPRLRFIPSAHGERKVAAVAMMPFRFTLR
jgi:protein TonB